MIKRLQALLLALVLAAGLTLAGCSGITQPAVDLGSVTIDSYQGDSPWVEVDGNQPAFSQDERESTEVFEEYSPLDFLGRCGVAYANLCPELMPTEERGAIGQIKPAGWHTVRYDWVDGEYLYNRCHLIGFQLAGENANQRNLITGTRYMNTQGMLPFENLVAEYIHETGNHVLYRVTPVYDGSDLVPWGVEMEAWSVEDQGDGVCFHVVCFNVEPGVVIDYATGESWAEEGSTTSSGETTYILNTNSRRFHDPDCPGAESMSPKNRQETTASRETLLAQGYEPCGECAP